MSLEFSDVPAWIDDVMAARTRTLVSQAEPLVADMQAAVGEVSAILDDLERTDVPKDAPTRLKKVLATSKPTYLSGMRDALAPFFTDAITEYRMLEAFHARTKSSLKKTAKLAVGPGRYLPATYGEEAAAIQKSLKEAKDCSEGLGSLLSSARAPRQAEEARAACAKAEEALEERAGLEAQCGQAQKKLERAREDAAQIECDIEELEHSPEMREAERREDDLRRATKAREAKAAEIRQSFSALARFFRKCDRAAREGAIELSDEERASLQALLDDPVAVVAEGDVRHLSALLAKAREALLGGKLSLDDKEVKKTANKIDFLRTQNYLAIQAELRDLAQRRKDLANEPQGAARDRLERLECTKNTMRQQVSALEKEEGILAKKLEQNGNALDTNWNKLTRSLELLHESPVSVVRPKDTDIKAQATKK